MNSTTWLTNDELFVRELSIGHQWASHVAGRLRAAGLDAWLTPMELRETIEQRHRWSQEVDLWIGSLPIEVKSRRLSFTDDPATFPYPGAFVDTVTGWDRKSPKPSAVLLVSQLTGGVLAVETHSTERWSVESKFDRVRGIDDRWYVAPRETLFPFEAFVRALRR